MVIAYAKLLGGLIRWLIKRCKTRLSDEIEGNFEGSWGGTYSTENYLIGMSTIIFILIIVVILIWW
jgi:hypothetical protein